MTVCSPAETEADMRRKPTIKTTIYLDPAVHRRVKMQAADAGVRPNLIINQILDRHVEPVDGRACGLQSKDRT